MNFKNNIAKNGFTLVELIIVVIIVGILASLGLTQYSSVVEKSRLAEAKVRVGVMRQLAYEYYLNNGGVSGIQQADVGVNNSCTTSDFFRYNVWNDGSAWYDLQAYRCTSSGKSPNASQQYLFGVYFNPITGATTWHCRYDDGSSCFGLPP
jgi:prepilin-type N-terminal cleavage/methylation domain-containing protein